MFFEVYIVDISIVEVPNQVVYQFRFLVDVIIYESLEDRRRIHETKRHDIELKGAIRCVKCGEPFLTLLDA